MSDNLEDMISHIKNNTDEENKALASQLQSRLSAEQSAKLNGILSNSDMLEKLMSTDAVKNIMKKLGGEQNGHQ